MSKRKRRAAEGRAGEKPSRARPRVRWVKLGVVIPLALCVLAAGAASLRWEPVRHAVGLAPLAEPQATPTPLPLSKEYIYAGGRLVATEEPTPPPSGPPPTNLIATATSAASVAVTWTAPAGTVSGYVVERAQSKDGPFVQIGATPASQPSFADAAPTSSQPPSADSSYLYRVRATYAGGGNSDYSNKDLATTVIFTDDPLVGSNDAHPPPATVIKATHLTELRRAVSAVHALAGLGAVTTWSYPDPVSSPASSRRAIYLEDVKDLRDRLDEALPALGRTPPAYAVLTKYVTKVGKDHFQQLRDAVK
jgi:hypothetical protein